MVGEVHDPRAFALGGVAGHAGVFSTASDIAKFCQMILNQGELDGHRIVKPQTFREWTTVHRLPDGTGARTYGFDVDTPYSPQARGHRFERARRSAIPASPARACGSIRSTNASVVLLTNRVHPSEEKGKVAEVRREVATAVADAFLGPAPTTSHSDAAKP